VILAISASLRRQSLNSAALRAAAGVGARAGIAVAIDRSPRTLPPFDSDLEVRPPADVERFRARCAQADGLLIAVPEYAHGIPGAFKNALDWTVGAGSLYRKPVAVLSVAPPGRGGDVREALERVLAALECDASYHSVPIRPAELVGGDVPHGAITRELLGVVEALAERAGRLRAR
jgi:chromate reductase